VRAASAAAAAAVAAAAAAAAAATQSFATARSAGDHPAPCLSAAATRPHTFRHDPKHCAPQVGWKHKDAVAELEAKRKAKAAAFYEAKKKAAGLRAKAVASL
jgi:hypothetical protein